MTIIAPSILSADFSKLGEEIKAVGHRVVHGGDYFFEPIIIDAEAKLKIKACSKIAPLHNPHNLEGTTACENILPKAVNVAVFDTAFHQTIPKHAFIYGIPYKYYEKHKIRRYGFHGTSHEYVAMEAARLLGKKIEHTKIITCHLGNGSSVCAIKEGKSVDTSMGFTPLEGLVMGTRCGDIDPAIVTFLMENEKMSVDEINRVLTEESGVLGISGMDNDMRVLRHSKEELAQLAVRAYAYRVKKYIGAYMAALNGADAIIFTAGVGEHASVIRKMILEGMDALGIVIDDEKNKNDEMEISAQDSKVKVFVIPTDEEKMIAREVAELIGKREQRR
jgi:acetate kinase